MSVVETAPAAAVRLRITEIFASLQGESTRVGLPTVFVRLTGCPLRCSWCDTAYAFSGGETRTLDDILAEVAGHGLRHVCVTGGEPLAQKGCLALLAALCDAGHDVSLETSGALDIAGVDPRVSRIVDLKAPGSGELARNRWENLALLNARDELKFVLADATDYDWARRQIAEHRLAERCTVLLSPVAGALDPADLAGWIVRDRLPVRFQLQLHKILWNDARGR
ncbi:MAG: 7-carboxy-7-deazaguanine synthase QueE [Thauera sp.]|jgi:7-carboxy-7-deazaguanine synthase|uniref:7-carboxy-7-deazaguanine synthase QueE n=1 Tax=Thauera sp. TaxID=1905334 RepID=UPI001D7509C1|nr:7-carboxy-7-deazaguanine synthase QueE [Thauera sp.]MCB1944777.1 7-carboxy-7-deazaguanine synthase QueE [Thauera sp.]MCP5226517.1 7-carboxy-7-deazaguanine synthase QueE [Thauera sp.]HPE03922.1 7-carboxy-7-deazaguanine synthase QueE [Thauera sp.]